MKAMLMLQSFLDLLRIDLLIGLGSLRAIHTLARREVGASTFGGVRPDIQAICHAMDLACVLYPKPVLCLQRSAATAVLLRRHGWTAEMVIGAELVPFRSHAWVEINGEVVNDKPYMREIYRVMERGRAD
jgi:hypothetical protein